MEVKEEEEKNDNNDERKTDENYERKYDENKRKLEKTMKENGNE